MEDFSKSSLRTASASITTRGDDEAGGAAANSLSPPTKINVAAKKMDTDTASISRLFPTSNGSAVSLLLASCGEEKSTNEVRSLVAGSICILVLDCRPSILVCLFGRPIE